MRVIKTEVSDFETGEVISTHETYGTNNGNNWVILYRKVAFELAIKCPSAATLRVLLMLISLQENMGLNGVICTRKHLQKTLNLSRKTVYNALTWLVDNQFIVETEHNGISEFFLNPAFVTVGRDKTARMRKWRQLLGIEDADGVVDFRVSMCDN